MSHKKFDSDDEDFFDAEEDINEASDNFGDESDDDGDDDALLPPSDDDSAPEDLGFESSKSAVLAQVKAAVEQIQQQKQAAKLKRKKQDEMFVQQKKKKLEALESCRLPDELLDSIEAKPVKVTKAKKSKKDKISIEEEEEEGETIQEMENSLEASEDFIPLETTDEEVVKAVYIKHQLEKSKSTAQKAAEFREKMLYGRKMNRHSVQSMLGQKLKRKVRKT